MNLMRSAIILLLGMSMMGRTQAEFLAGAAVVDVTPDQMPVLVNGGMFSRSADSVKTRVNARAVVLADDHERIGLVVVDSCMVPRILLDDAKQRAAARTKLSPDRIMVSATHTHTAPSSFGALGTAADQSYVPFLREKIAEALVEAERRLQPARVGWGSADAREFTALRRWVRRPDRLDRDPFGNATVRANMHAARNLDDVTGQSGPEDPELAIIGIESTDGVPIAAIANFSMHYFGDQPISADYFGLFCEGLEKHARKRDPRSQMVGIMSHGCSGDIWRRDYVTWKEAEDKSTIESYTQGLLEVATQIYDSIQYDQSPDLAMAETRLSLNYRVPDAQLLEWSRRITDEIEDDLPKDRTQVYAREQIYLHQMQSTEVVIQAIRIGEIGIATTPNETYALTGLKLKLQSPLRHTMVIELANGADGYIPPPEQHHLGGYNTWAARSAGLEVNAEPKLVAANLNLLEQVSGEIRKQPQESIGPAAEKILAADPVAYWRLADLDASMALDAGPGGHDAVYEPGVCFFLPGDGDRPFTQAGQLNRCAHFAGGRLRGRLAALSRTYTVEMSIWNGMPVDARPIAGWMFSRDHPHAISARGEHLGLTGTFAKPGRLVFQFGTGDPVVGKTALQRWTWHRVKLVREATRARVFLDGHGEPEIDVVIPEASETIATCFVGGRSDNQANWEGRIDEVAVFD